MGHLGRAAQPAPNLGADTGMNLAETGTLAIARHLEEKQVLSAVSLLFERGARPDASAIQSLAQCTGTFSVSHVPEEGNGTANWAELLINGLTYDLVGLSPGDAEATPVKRHSFGLVPTFSAADHDAVALAPGPHLISGAAMFPVVRAQAELAARLCELPGVVAVAWHPANSLSEPGYFREAVLRWIDGGAFPGLGLAALAPTASGGLKSEGFAHFTGQEVMLDPALCEPRSDAPKIALRLMHWLVEHGTLEESVELTGPSGEPLKLIVNEGSSIVTVWRGGT